MTHGSDRGDIQTGFRESHRHDVNLRSPRLYPEIRVEQTDDASEEPAHHDGYSHEFTDDWVQGSDAIPARRQREPVRYSDDPFLAEPARAMDVVYDDVLPTQRSRGRIQRQKPDRVTDTALQAASIQADVVTGTRGSVARPAASTRDDGRAGSGSRRRSRVVVPSFSQITEQVLPMIVMIISLVAALLMARQFPSLQSLWAPIVLAPSALLYFFAGTRTNPWWRHSALMNLISVGVFYPLLVVRQSYLRIPFVEWGNGTLRMPVISTITIVGFLVALALIASFLCQDDPEYASALFLPAVLLVPFYAGATEIVSLRTALLIAIMVFTVSTVLTLVMSVLPRNYGVFVAPIALALEFLILPLAESVPIFPIGAGLAAKLLFFVVLATAVGLTVAIPGITSWMQSVRRMVFAMQAEPVRSR